MNIALFGNSYKPYISGVTNSMEILRNELILMGHRVYVFGPKYPGHKDTDPDIYRMLSFPTPYPGYRLVLPFSLKAVRLCAQRKIDIIHVHAAFGVGLFAMFLSKAFRIPLVYHYHTLFERYVHHVRFVPKPLARSIIVSYIKWFCNHCDAVIVPTTMVKRLLSRRKIKPPVYVAPTGVVLGNVKQTEQLANWRVEIRKKYGLSQDAPIILFSGRLAKEKNVEFVLRAFAKISKELPQAYFMLAAFGPEEENLKKLARDLGIDKKTVFTGKILYRDIFKYHLAADLFIYSSVTETQGMVLTEAKACGLPAVAVFSGALADIIESGKDGYLVPKNVDVFAEHALRILKDPQLHRKMSIRAKDDIQERFSSRVVAKKIESVYNLLQNREGAR